MRLLVLIACVTVLMCWVSHTAVAEYAMEFFADAGDSAQAPDSDSLDVDGKKFTMEAWAKATGPQNGDGIIINKENAYECALREGDKFMFAIHAGAWDWFGGGKPKMNEWHHFAVTYDGKTTQGWIDGKAAPGATDRNNQNITKQDGAESPFQVGRRVCCGTTPFLGIIDEVRISDVVRYTKNFTPPDREFEPDKNTRLLWHFNEGKGKKINDASGNKNVGEVIGKATWSKDAAPVRPAAVDPGGKVSTMWGRLKVDY